MCCLNCLYYSYILSVSYAEILAAWLGLAETAGCLKDNNIYLEGDSTIAIIKKILSLCMQSNKTHHPILHDIHRWILDCGHFSANHVYREANQAARYVARHALHTKWSWSNYDNIPHDLLLDLAG